MPRTISPEKLALAQQCINEGWTQREMYRVHRINDHMIRKYFPGYRERADTTATPELLAAIKQCVTDGWPIAEIARTHGTSWATVRKYFPDYQGMSFQEAGRLGMTMRRAARPTRRVPGRS